MSSDSATAVRAVRSPSSNFIPALDGVRGLAICGVLLVHSYELVTDVLPRTTADAIQNVANIGAFGVDLFFVLSGFLITGILLDTRESPGYFRNFYARRFLRLFPVYYGYVLFIALVLPRLHVVLRTTMPDYKGNWWWYILYFCNWKPAHAAHDPYLFHFWSLAVEEQFYILWPAVVFVLPRRILTWTCCVLSLASVALRVTLANQNVDWQTIQRLTVTRLDALAIGALAAIALRSAIWRQLALRYAIPVTLVGLVAFVVLGAAAGGLSWELKTIQSFGSFVATVGFAGLVLQAALVRSGWLIRFLENPVLTSYGKYSYGMYVYHVVVMGHCAWIASWTAHRSSPRLALPIGIVAFVVSNILAFFVAHLSFIHFEKRVLRYKDRFQ